MLLLVKGPGDALSKKEVTHHEKTNEKLYETEHPP